MSSLDYGIDYMSYNSPRYGWLHQAVANGTWIGCECMYIWWRRYANMKTITDYNDNSYHPWGFEMRYGFFKNGQTIQSFSASLGNDNLNTATFHFGLLWDFRAGAIDVPSGGFVTNRIRYINIIKGNALVMELRPVRIGQVGYFYDKISGELFGNIGTGDFGIGNDIYNPTSYNSEVEYLESTGLQYIDTGITPTVNTKFEIRYQYTSINLLGGSGLSPVGGGRRFHINTYEGKIHVGCGTNNNWKNTINVDTNIHQVALQGNGSFTVDGTAYSTGGSVGDFSGTYIYLFRIFGQSEYTNGYRLYSAKIYEGEELVRDYIPVRVGSLGYMYDRVSGKLYGNEGVGAFVLGNDVN